MCACCINRLCCNTTRKALRWYRFWKTSFVSKDCDIVSTLARIRPQNMKRKGDGEANVIRHQRQTLLYERQEIPFQHSMPSHRSSQGSSPSNPPHRNPTVVRITPSTSSPISSATMQHFQRLPLRREPQDPVHPEKNEIPQIHTLKTLLW